MEPSGTPEERAANSKSAMTKLPEVQAANAKTGKGTPDEGQTAEANSGMAAEHIAAAKVTSGKATPAGRQVSKSKTGKATPGSGRTAKSKTAKSTSGSGRTTKPKTAKATSGSERTARAESGNADDMTTVAAKSGKPADDVETAAVAAKSGKPADDVETATVAAKSGKPADDVESTAIAKRGIAKVGKAEPGTAKIDKTKRGFAKRGIAKIGKAKTPPLHMGSRLPALLSAEEIAPESDLEPLAESVRYILARPQIAVDGDLPSRIAVTAALPGEGVTTVSSVFSSVLSYDSNVETCRVDLSWGSDTKPGVYEVVVDNADIDAVLEWNGPSATLHSGGVSPSERHRLARSEELDKLIAVLASRFQHVVLDLPAILGGSDGLAMMRLADAYLLVVKHGVTTLQQVQIATEQLSEVESLGSVLNQVRTRTPRPLSRWLAG